MSFIPSAPTPDEAPIPVGTDVSVDTRARFIERGLVSGGSPWRLLRLPGSSRDVLSRWHEGARVREGEERFARTLVQQGLLHPHYDVPLERDDIDVVIPVRDNLASLANLLGQLDGLNVTVVDDGSADGGRIAECAIAHGAALVRLDENRGPGAARNAGAKEGTAPVLWFIDVDVALKNARATARTLRSEFEDPLLGAVSPRIQGADGPSRREKFEHHFGALDLGAQSGLVVPGAAVGYVPSACLMVRRASFGDGFDESLRYGEDVDFVWRLHDQGWLVRYRADSVVTHHARTSWLEWWRQRQTYGASSATLAERHGSRLAPFRADAWTLTAWVSVLVGQPELGARIVSGARRHARDTIFSSSEDPNWVAGQVVARNMIHAGGPLARAVVRTFGAVLLLSALHPRLRAKALALFFVGTAWRWRHDRPEWGDVLLGVADDLAYGTGVMRGAWRAKSFASLTPKIARPSIGLREVLGLSRPNGSTTGSLR